MLLPKFEYFAPKSVGEACLLLSQKEKAKVIAGGTDLLVKMKKREALPQSLIGLRNIPNLDYIQYDEVEGLRIGALASIQSIADSPIIRKRFDILAEAAATMGTPQVRNMGTIGGNLCNASPSADTAPPLLVLGASVRLVSQAGERVIGLEKFFTGPGETVLQSDEILTEIQISTNLPPNTGGAYLKLLPRSNVDLAAVSVAVLITLGPKNGICNDVKIALGAVAPTPLRAYKAEEAVKGKELERSVIELAAQLASEEARPISDLRSSAEYRREMVKVLTKRAIRQAWERAKIIT